MSKIKIEMSKTEVEVLQEIVATYNTQFGDLKMQTPDKEKAYEAILKKLKIT